MQQILGVSTDHDARSFSSNAQKLCGQIALLLGWRPSEFWDATPHEIGLILSANDAQNSAPIGRDALDHLLQLDQLHSNAEAQ